MAQGIGPEFKPQYHKKKCIRNMNEATLDRNCYWGLHIALPPSSAEVFSQQSQYALIIFDG
jgi:hypothetical protein